MAGQREDSSSDARVGTVLDGRYKLVERLAAGGMGVVYRGEALAGKTQVAVKFLHDALAGVTDLVKRFDREVEAMRRLSHPNLVGIIDSGLAAGVPFLVMEFQSGRSLADVLERGALVPARAVRIARQVLDGVAHAHASGVVHRDLKPDNIILVGDGPGEMVRILDFGLAKMASDVATRLTNTGIMLGTPGYMAPEQARGAPTDERSDIYSTGVVLYHMVVGRKPFIAEQAMAVLRMHLEDPPMPPRRAAPDAKLSPALEQVILRALEKEPAKRWPSAEAFRGALDTTPEGQGRGGTVAQPRARTQLGRKPKKEKPRKADTPSVVAQAQKVRRMWLVRAGKGGGALVMVGLVAWAGFVGWAHLSRRGQQKVADTVDRARQAAKEAWRSISDKTNDQAKPPTTPTTPPKPMVSEDDDDTDAEPTNDTPGYKLEAASHDEGPKQKKASVATAAKQLQAGHVDEAILTLYRVRRVAPRSPSVALLLGHAYFRKVWRHDGLREYWNALRLMPALRHDRLLIRNTVTALEDPTYRLARTIIRRRIGSAALIDLRRAAHGGGSAKVQKRAQRLVAEVTPSRPSRPSRPAHARRR